jgi:hypothetical protein
VSTKSVATARFPAGLERLVYDPRFPVTISHSIEVEVGLGGGA